MASRTIEAKLVISGEDHGASAAINKVVQAVKQMEDAAKVAKPLQDVARSLHQVEQASKAVEGAMKARTGFSQAEAGLKATCEAATAAAKALDDARKARTAYDGVKAAKGSEQAAQIQAATKAVRELSAAHRRAEGDVRKATAAVEAQASTMERADAVARRAGADLTNLEGHQRQLRATYDQTTAAIMRQVEAQRRVNNVAGTMSGAGRAQLDRIEGGRRVSAGMSAPAREARAAADASIAAAASRSLEARRARDAAMGVAGAAAGGVANNAYVKARDGWLEMDEASRRQKAVLGLTDQKQATLNAQALKIGQDTRFSNPDVVKAQTRIGSSLPNHLKDPGVIAAVTENSKDYALAMGTTMDEGSSAILGRMLGLRMDMSNPEAAAASAKHAANRLVQFAKSSGADHNDLMGYTRFGAAPGSVGGFSEEFSDAMAAQLRRIGYEGAMAGNFVRAAATKLAVPTSKGFGVLAAAGINHSDYVAPGKALSENNLSAVLKQKFGTGLNDSQRQRIRALMDDEDIVGNREEFVPRVSAIVQETLAKRTKKGQVNANDAERITKSVNDYMTAAAGAVDIERLMLDVILKGITPAMAKYLFGQEHGGRAQALDAKTLSKDVETFRNTPENRAQKIGEDINAGSYGAYQRMVGSIETFWMKLGQVNDGPLTMFYDKMGNAVDAVTNLPSGVIQAGTAVGGLAAAAVAARGALGVFRIGKDLLGFGGLSGSAAALTQSATLLDAAAIKLAGGLPGGPLTEAAKKGSRLLPFLAGAGVAGLGAGAIGYILSEYGDPSKSVNGTGGRPDDRLTLNPSDELPGLSGSTDAPSWAPKAAPSMTLAPGAMPMTIQGSGISAFGLSGPTDPATAGQEAGQKAGKGVADGIEQKAPEVESKGRGLFERLKSVFSEGIFVPINFVPGGAGGGAGLQNASFGGGGGEGGGIGGLIQRANFGGGRNAGLGGGGGGGRALSARDMRDINPEFAAHIRASALSQGIDPDIALRIANSEGLRGSNPNRLTPGDYENGKPTSFGPFQLHYGRSGGLGNRYTAETGHHASDPRHWREQIDFALRIARKEGWGAWYGRRGAGIGVRDGIGTVKPIPMKRGGDPRLVKGADGVEGLDLGNGTMQMPDKSIRPIPTSIPGRPEGGFGEAGRAGIGRHVEDFGRHVDRLATMGFDGQVQLSLSGPGAGQARVTGIKARGRGGMNADMGISMPGAKDDPSDWV